MVRCGHCDRKVMYCPECGEPVITNRKIAGIGRADEGFVPQWREYRGFSLLFDNPGGQLPQGSRLAATGGFYKQLGAAVGKLEGGCESLAKNYLFCPLPPDSYHVTFLDGVNSRNRKKLNGRYEDLVEVVDFVDKLPSSKPPHCLSFLSEKIPIGPLAFKFARLSTFKTFKFVVARLQPTDRAAAKALAMLKAMRSTLNETMLRKLGVQAGSGYNAHVTLGYFANDEGGRVAKTKVGKKWNEAVRDAVNGLTLAFNSISLYGFTDMANYFRM